MFKKLTFIVLGLLILGGAAFAASQSSWLKGTFGEEDELDGGGGVGGMEIGETQTADGGFAGGGFGGAVDAPTDDDDDLPFGPGTQIPGGPGPTGGGGTTPTEDETYHISLTVFDSNDEGISGLTSSNFDTDSGSIEEVSEGSDGSYDLEMSGSGTFTITVEEDGYITKDTDAETWGSQDDSRVGYSVELPYSHVVTVVDEDSQAITGATVKVGTASSTTKGDTKGTGTWSRGDSIYEFSTGTYKTCENYESNKYGCNNSASSTKRDYTVTKSGYDSASGTFTSAYTASSTSSVTVTVTLTKTDEDEDGDGLLASEEEELGTDPIKADTDGDGLKDGEEVNDYETDPTEEDSDSDYLNDGDEVEAGTNPLDKDSDDDDLYDYNEITITETDPLDKDSDDDGLTDLVEVEDDYGYDTDPNDADSDNDGLTDGEELLQTYGYPTDPTDTDTDDGGVGDATEVKTNGTDPTDRSDDVPTTSSTTTTTTTTTTETTTSYACSSVSFSPSSYELDADDSEKEIDVEVTISFDSTIASWQKSLFAMLSPTLASTETWTDTLVMSTDGDGDFEEESSGDSGNPLYIDLSTDDGTSLTYDFTITVEDGDILSAYIEGDKECKDRLVVSQEEEEEEEEEEDTSTTVTADDDDDDDDSYTTTLDAILMSESYNCSDTFTDTEEEDDSLGNIICRMYQADIVEGRFPPYLFVPDYSVKNSEAIKMVVALIAQQDEGDAYGLTESFTDVKDSDWFSDWVKIAQELDIIRVKDFNGYFFPELETTRCQLALDIVRALGETSYNYEMDFSDMDGDEYCAYAVDILSETEVDVPYDDDDEKVPVISGYSDGTFRPDNNVQRDEALAMIYRAYLSTQD